MGVGTFGWGRMHELLMGSLAMGFGANWLTEWFSDDGDAARLLGLAPGERIAGMIMIGTAGSTLDERPRPDLADLATRLDF